MDGRREQVRSPRLSPDEGAGGVTLPRWASARAFTVLAGASGFCALGYEVLYLRHLTTLLGDMMYVHAALLSAFLLGVALGALLAHRFHGGLVYLEAATGLYALVLPAVTAWMGAQSWMVIVTASGALTAGVTAALVLVPGLLVGFSMPLFAAYAKERRREGLAFQSVYTAYNLGALAGIAVVELVLIRVLGIRWSLAVLAATNLAVAGFLWAARTRSVTRPKVEARRFGGRILAAVATASFAAAVFQMFFLKVTYLVFTPHRENFAVALGVSLLGIGMGSLWASRTPVRVQTALLLVPVSIGGIFLVHPLLADLFTAVYQQLGMNPAGGRLTRWVFAAVYGLVPSAAFGAVLPALMRREEAVAEESGFLLFVSALANAAGYLLFVFLLQPLLPGSIVLLVIGAGAAGAAVVVAPPLGTVERGMAGVAAVLTVALLGTWHEVDFHLARYRAAVHRDGVTVSTFKWGGEDASLVEEPGRSWISYNGYPSIAVEVGGITNAAEMLSGLIPALSAPTLDRALVLGMGTGITAGAAARVFDEVDVVEINRAFVDMAPHLRSHTGSLDVNPRAHIHVTDGRAFLRGRNGVYDVVVNSVPTPTFYAAGKIYTLEFYRDVRRALKPDGVFATWLSAGDLTRAGLTTVLVTLREVWPWCDLRPLRSNYYMATCGAERPRARPASDLPIPGDLERALSRSLGGVGLRDYLDALLVSSDLLSALPSDAGRVNRDDRPLLEFQVMDAMRPGPPVPDNLKQEPERYGIDPLEGMTDPRAIITKAVVLEAIDHQWLAYWFLPLFARDPGLAAAWEGRETAKEEGA